MSTPTAPTAMDILKRIREANRPIPLRIIDTGDKSVIKIARLNIGTHWWVRFNRVALAEEVERMREWCADNCSHSYAVTVKDVSRPTDVDGFRFNDRIDWNLFMTTFK